MVDELDVEYIGDPEVMDEVMSARIALGMIPLDAANVIRGAALMRCTAVKGVNKRMVDQESFGTSKEYEFGPQNFVTKVLKRDYEKIKASSCGHQFRVPSDPMNALILPRGGESGIRIVNTIEMNKDQANQAIKSGELGRGR